VRREHAETPVAPSGDIAPATDVIIAQDRPEKIVCRASRAFGIP
jgi:hypothetical protein